MIDSHVHLWTDDEARYPRVFGSSPSAPRRFAPEDYLRHAEPLGTQRTVLIQMDFYGFDNSYLLDVIETDPGVFRGVAQIDRNTAGLAKRMRELKLRGISGFRIEGVHSANEWPDDASMHTMWDCAAKEYLAICPLIGPESLPVIDRMCERHADTRVVVDHFGRIGVSGVIETAHVDDLYRLARHGNTYVKLSAFYALGKKASPYHDLLPLIRRVFDAFGPQRLMWGSDCPFQVEDGHDYASSVALIRGLDFASDADKEFLLRKTAESVFFLGEP